MLKAGASNKSIVSWRNLARLRDAKSLLLEKAELEYASHYSRLQPFFDVYAKAE